MSGATAATAATTLLGAAAVGLAVVDVGGTIREVNEPLAAIVGRPHDRLVGRSILDLAHPDDLDVALDVLVAGGRLSDDVTVGPVRLRCLDAGHGCRPVQVWSRRCVGDDGSAGFVLTFAASTTSDELVRAMAEIAAARPVDDVLLHVVAALGMPPFVIPTLATSTFERPTPEPSLETSLETSWVQGRSAGEGDAPATILAVRDGGLVPVGPWPLGSTSSIDDRLGDQQMDAPWHTVRRSGAPVDVLDPAHLPRWLRDACELRRIRSIWCRPIVTRDGEVAAVVVVWRHRAGAPNASEASHLASAMAVAALAFDQEAYRCSRERAVVTDALTGLGNRARLEQLLAAPDDDVTGVLFIDLDDFEAVNRRFGRAAGDEVLVAVADRLRNALRSRDEVLRVGGDEFVVICRAPGSPGGTEVVADRVVGVLSGPYHVNQATEPVLVSASIGVDSSRPGLRLQQRIDWADEAMYSAKTFGTTWRRRSSPRP